MEKESKGIKIVYSENGKSRTEMFMKNNYSSEDEFDKAWLKLTRKLSEDGRGFTADPVYEEE